MENKLPRQRISSPKSKAAAGSGCNATQFLTFDSKSKRCEDLQGDERKYLTEIPHGCWEGGSEMLLRCCTCNSSSFTIRQKIGQGIVRTGGFGEAMDDSGKGQVLLRVQVLIWLDNAGVTSSFVWSVCSWPCSPVGYGDLSLLPDGHDPPEAEA